MEYTKALEGRVRCKRCQRAGEDTYIDRLTKAPRELIHCPVCGWQIQWRVYVSETEKGTSGQLAAGNARRAFEEFLRVYPRVKEPEKKMVAIDQLIHEFHWMLRGETRKRIATRTACVCLLEGTYAEIMALLDGLTYGEDADPALKETRDWWNQQNAIKRRHKDD